MLTVYCFSLLNMSFRLLLLYTSLDCHQFGWLYPLYYIHHHYCCYLRTPLPNFWWASHRLHQAQLIPWLHFQSTELGAGVWAVHLLTQIYSKSRLSHTGRYRAPKTPYHLCSFCYVVPSFRSFTLYLFHLSIRLRYFLYLPYPYW